MKLGIRSLSYVAGTKVSDFSMLPPGSRIKFSDFLSGDLVALPFTPETADFSEQWNYDENGEYSEVQFTASVRADKENYRDILRHLSGKNHIYRVELISGVKYIIGSREFMPTFSYSDRVSGNSSNGFTIMISCRSLHGCLIDE